MTIVSFFIKILYKRLLAKPRFLSKATLVKTFLLKEKSKNFCVSYKSILRIDHIIHTMNCFFNVMKNYLKVNTLICE